MASGKPLVLGVWGTALAVLSLSVILCHWRSSVPRAALGGYSMPCPGILQKQHPQQGGSQAAGNQGGMVHHVPSHVIVCCAIP